ncbi:MAG: DUF1924 domain-containing protein [Pseudomonadota bacterium]|nr:DUF1924 domain-containing protein [Pseudomonadota bacterium]
MKYRLSFLLVSSLMVLPPAYATEAVQQLLADYQQQGASTFSAEAGKALFFKEFKDESSGKMRQCISCHTEHLTQQGEHVKTGKIIKPLAPSVNPDSLTEVRNMRKWLKRNCKWTSGRECTPQEKGDVLTFIQQQ